MKIVGLIRIESGSEGTFGVLRIGGKAFCVTLEPMNPKDVYVGAHCIPIGSYICKPIDSPKFGHTFKVQNVPNRSGILFHPGNTIEDTTGCILLGDRFGKLRGDRAILNSGNTFKEFISIVGSTPFNLTIMDGF